MLRCSPCCYDPGMTDANKRFDLYSHEFKADPYGTFDAMRRTRPVHCQIGMDGQTQLWFATGYDAVEEILRNEAHFARDLRAQGAEAPIPDADVDNLLNNHMLSKDGDDHRRLRTLVSQAFTPRRVRQMRPNVEAITNALLDDVTANGRMDLIGDFAFHLPTIVILEMLGVPPADREQIRDWSNAIIMPVMDEAEWAAVVVQMKEFVAYLRQLFEQRRVEPTGDMISALVHAEADGDQLDEGELLGMLMLLIVAGHETTVNLIANAMVALWENPEQMVLLKDDPGLMPSAVEEFLRYDGSVERAFARYVREDVELAGQRVPQGSMIVPILAAADRDSAVFDSADRLDITRSPNPHMGFGKGVHYCLGAPLARIEAEIALNTLLQRLPDMRLAVPTADLRWRLTPTFRSLEALPVEW